MRVVMVCRKYSGLEREAWAPAGTPAVVKLIEEFERRGHETTVLLLSKSADSKGSLPRKFVTDYGSFRHVTFIYIGWRGRAGIPSILSDILNDARQFFLVIPHLVRRADLFYFDRAHLGFAALTSLFRRNVVWRCLGVMSFLIAKDQGKRAGAIYLWLARLLMRFPIRLMICTNDGSPWFRVFPRNSRSRLLLLTNGVDKPAGNPPSASKNHQVPVVGFVGRATLTKGLDTFVAACSELQRRNISFRAIVVGEGHFRDQAVQMAAASGIGTRIEFVGGVPHARMGDYFNLIDIYVTPARNGAFSNTTLEALASGCCVVALSPDERTGVDVTTVKFLPEDIVSWVEPRDAVRQCADAIARLLADVDELADRRKRGQAFSESEFQSWPHRIQAEADIYEDVAQSRQVTPGALQHDKLARLAFEIVQ